jgi:hypothetical protein
VSEFIETKRGSRDAVFCFKKCIFVFSFLSYKPSTGFSKPFSALVRRAVMEPRREPRPMEPKKMPKNLAMVLKKASALKESALPVQSINHMLNGSEKDGKKFGNSSEEGLCVV